MLLEGEFQERAARLGEERPLEELLALREQALPLFQEAAEITAGLERVNDADIRTGRDVALCLNKLGNQQRVFGWENSRLVPLREALETFESSLARRQSLWDDDHLPQNGHDLAVGLFKVAEVMLMLAERDPEADAGALTAAACDLLGRSALRFAEAGGHGYPVSPALRLITRYRTEAGCDGGPEPEIDGQDAGEPGVDH